MNILVIKIGALGDVLRTSFIAQALKDKYKEKNPEIYWITDKKTIPFFANNIYVDKIILNEEKNKLKNVRFDLIINLEEDAENAKFASSLNKKKLIGAFWNKNGVDYTKEASYWLDMSLISKLGKRKADMLKRKNKKTHRQIISEVVGIEYDKYEPSIRLNEKQKRLARDFMRWNGLRKNELIIGINSGSADKWPKQLPVEKTINLINDIHKKYSAKILLFGGPNETERNREIINNVKASVINVGCGQDLYELPALVSICNLFITTDSLCLHIALSQKIKTICLIGPTSPSEIDMYGLGEKIISKSKDVCSYKTKTNCMEKIKLKEVLSAVDKLIKQKITLIITSFKEPEIVGNVIESALKQETEYKYDIIVAAPDEETLNVVRNYKKKFKNVDLFKDPGKGKSFAINLLLKKVKSDILIFTDGDVTLGEKSIRSISNLFYNQRVGCVSGRPVPKEGKNKKYGFWANFLFNAAHEWRKRAFDRGEFLECSGYLFAFRNNKINNFPLDVAEDAIIPYLFWEKGYEIGYAEDAKVFVKNPDNLKDWIKQKKRSSKAHENLDKYANTKITRRIKTFLNESRGIKAALSYPSSLNEFIWMLELIAFRTFMWASVFFDTKIRNSHFGDAWERIESTK